METEKSPKKKRGARLTKHQLQSKKAGYMGAFTTSLKTFLSNEKVNTKHILPIFGNLQKYCRNEYKRPRQMFVGMHNNEDGAWEKFFEFADELKPGFLFDVRPGNKVIRIPFELVIKITNKTNGENNG